MEMLRVSIAGPVREKNLYMPKAAPSISVINTTTAPKITPLCLRASVMRTELDDDRSDVTARPRLEIGAADPGKREAERSCEALLLSLPDSLSRFRRFRSARISDAC